MQSPHGQVWFVFSDDLPEGEILVPVKNEYGLAVVVRPGAGLEPQMLDRLNEAAAHVLGVGIVHLGDTEAKPRERED